MTIPYVVAGPNGCGKSSLTRGTWFSDIEVIDPDAIAHGRRFGMAAREALHRRKLALDTRQPHLEETTLAGSGIFPPHESCATGKLQDRPALCVGRFARTGAQPYS